jgi:hypothetical protein
MNNDHTATSYGFFDLTQGAAGLTCNQHTTPSIAYFYSINEVVRAS